MRRVLGVVSAVGTLVPLAIYVATLRGTVPLAGKNWPYFAGTALVFIGGAMAYRVLLPHYKIEHRVQLHKLRPFFSQLQYASIWLVLAVAVLGVAAGGAAFQEGGHTERALNQVFAAGWFGGLYINALILLCAQEPRGVA